MQQYWKGLVGAADKASHREDSNTNSHLPQDPFSIVPNTDWGYGHATVSQTLFSKWALLQAEFTHAAYLQQQWPVFTWWLMGTWSWSISLGWDFSITTSKLQALEKTAWKRGRSLCGVAGLPPTVRLTPKHCPEFTLQYQPLKSVI